MKNFYLQGATSDEEELQEITGLFDEQNLDVSTLYDNYNAFTLESEAHMQERIVVNAFPYLINGGVNLICHSLGCNLGILAANHTKKIKKLVLISPDFTNPDEKEKEAIKRKAERHDYFGEEVPEEESRIKLGQIRNLILFKRTQKKARHLLKTIETPTLIIYSEGDSNISQTFLNIISHRNNIELEEIASCSTNPLLEEQQAQKVLTAAKDFLK